MKRKIDAAKKIQKAYRRYCRLKILRNFAAAIHKMLKGLHTVVRIFKVRKTYRKFQQIRKAVRTIQKFYRKLRDKIRMKRMGKSIVKLQLWWKMIFLTRRFKRVKRAAGLLNRVIRGTLTRRRAARRRIVQKIIDV